MENGYDILFFSKWKKQVEHFIREEAETILSAYPPARLPPYKYVVVCHIHEDVTCMNCPGAFADIHVWSPGSDRVIRSSTKLIPGTGQYKLKSPARITYDVSTDTVEVKLGLFAIAGIR
jgi:hypothetical protein